MTWNEIRGGILAGALVVGALVTTSVARASPVMFDFVGPMIGSRDALTFEQAGLTLTVSGTNLSTGAPAKVTQWELGLGVRTVFPNNGDGDGALDSIGDDELLEFGFTRLDGLPVSVQLGMVLLQAFGDVDDLTLWVDGVVVLGPDYHPQSASWDPSQSVAPGALWGSRFGLSVSDESPTWEDDYFRVSALTVFDGSQPTFASTQALSVPEPGTWALLALGVLAAGGVRRDSRRCLAVSVVTR